MTLTQQASAVLFIDYSSIFETGKSEGKWTPFNIVLRNLERQFGRIVSYVYLRNGYPKVAEMFANLGTEVVPCLANCDFIMGFDISEVIARLNPEMVIIASHDGGLRQVADRIERGGRRVVFIAYPRSKAFSSFLQPKSVIDIEVLAREEVLECDNNGLPIEDPIQA